MSNISSDVHGGDGDDLIGVEMNLSGGAGKRQTFYGDGGDDTFYLRTAPSDSITNFFGGDGYDTFLLDWKNEASLVSQVSTDAGVVLTFAYWQKNGVTSQTSVVLNGFERIGFDGFYVEWSHGNAADPNTGLASQVWSDNGGFG